MNLIEQQTAAKELPMQYLQQAVNGQNPNLTPWIATAELQRRTTMNQHMQNAQGPQGPQPTVKDQVEQKAGLMATQAAQQAQAAQAQQSATPPGPVPAGVPQPEPQPEEPVMAARGGLMGAPVHFNFAHGGILGYAGDEDGSYVDPASGMAIRGMPEQGEAAAGSGALGLFSSEPEWKKAARAHAKGERYVPPPGYDDEGLPIKQQAAAPRHEAEDRAPRPSLQGQGIKAALPQPAPTQRPPAPPAQVKPAPQAVQQPPAMDPEQQIAADYTKSATPQASMETAIGNEQQLAKRYGLDQPIGAAQEAQQARQDALQKQQQEQAKKLAWSAFVQGTVGTPGSGSLAYDQTMANALGVGAEYEGTRYKNISDLETARRTASEKRAGVAGADYGKQQEAQAAALKDKATVAAHLFGTTTQATIAAAQNMSAKEVALIHAAAMNRPGETERIMATALGLKATNPAKYAAYMETLSGVRGAGKPDQGAAAADKAFDNIKGLMDKNPLLQSKYTKDPAAFQAAVEAETTRIRNAGGTGGSAGTMAPDRAAQFKVIRP